MKKRWLLWLAAAWAAYVLWRYTTLRAAGAKNLTIVEAAMNSIPLSLIRGGSWYSSAPGGAPP